MKILQSLLLALQFQQKRMMLRMKRYEFYDTSSLLLLADQLFEDYDPNVQILISSITLQELEKIKSAANKDANIKHATRLLLQKLDTNIDKYFCIVYYDNLSKRLHTYSELNNDSKIIASALDYYQYKEIHENFFFFTNDLAMKQLARLYFKDSEIKSVYLNKSKYKGFIDITLDDTEMAKFYEQGAEYNSIINAKINEYINIYNSDQERVDTVCWTGEEFRPLKYKVFDSDWFGCIKPYKGDIYQAMAADSLLNNQITMLRGPSGAGKSHIALGYLFHLLDHHKIDKIIVFCNTVATKNAARLGFYPGSKNEKLLDAQIGNMLSSKLGGEEALLRLIEEEKLILLPMSDIRGYDTSGMNAGIYITEAQNLDITLAKLALQRVGEDCIMILDGDTESQVDLIEYDGVNNGMRRISKIFRGHDFYGEVTLQQIHRSKIAELANQL